MIRKGKLVKNTAIALAIISVFSSTVSSVSAMEAIENIKTISEEGIDVLSSATTNPSTKEEDINTKLLHETEEKDSSANKYLVSSKLVTENNKKYMVMTFDNTDGLLKKLIGIVNGVEVETSNEFSEDSKILTVKFEVSSLENLKLSFTYYNPYFQKDHTVFAIIQVGTSEAPETPDTEIKPEIPDTGTTPDDDSDKEEITNKYEDGYYQVNNIVAHDSETGKEMARKLLSEATKMQVENGKIHLTFTMNKDLSGFVKDISAKVDNKTVDIKKVDDNNFIIEVPSLDSKLQLSMYITMMGSSQVFDITFDENTVESLSSTENSTNGSNDNENNNSSSNESNNGGNNNSSLNEEEVKDEVVKGKLYTIKNEVVYDNEIGYNMVRQYLNETTKIEKIGEKTYSTLTFTGVNLMQNHKVYVNGSVVNHTIVSKTSDSISIRFEISDINDDIQVQLFVVPMNKTVKFGVKLLEDTLSFVKEYTVENSEENIISNETLPQTGSTFGSEMLLGLGGLLTASGALLRRKRK